MSCLLWRTTPSRSEKSAEKSCTHTYTNVMSWKQTIYLHKTKHRYLCKSNLDLTARLTHHHDTMVTLHHEDCLHHESADKPTFGMEMKKNHRQTVTNQRKWGRAVSSEAVLRWRCDRGAACILCLKWKKKSPVSCFVSIYRHNVITWLSCIEEKRSLTCKWRQTDSRNL